MFSRLLNLLRLSRDHTLCLIFALCDLTKFLMILRLLRLYVELRDTTMHLQNFMRTKHVEIRE